MDNTRDEMFAITAIEYGMHPDDLARHFESEIDIPDNNGHVVIDINELEIVEENEWNINGDGVYYYPYTVNGIACIMWEIENQFVLERGNNLYQVDDYDRVYNDNAQVGTLTANGDIVWNELFREQS